MSARRTCFFLTLSTLREDHEDNCSTIDLGQRLRILRNAPRVQDSFAPAVDKAVQVGDTELLAYEVCWRAWVCVGVRVDGGRAPRGQCRASQTPLAQHRRGGWH